jgi:hypothetical protein
MTASVVRRKYCYTKEYVKPRNLAAFTRLPRRVSRPAVLRLGNNWRRQSQPVSTGLSRPALAMLKLEEKDAEAPYWISLPPYPAVKNGWASNLRESRVNAAGAPFWCYAISDALR